MSRKAETASSAQQLCTPAMRLFESQPRWKVDAKAQEAAMLQLANAFALP